MNNRPNPTINHTPYMSMDQQNSEYAERISPQRRVMRQSTIPANITHMDQYSYQNTMNLLPPPSPDQQHISPQYSPYNTDSEDIMDASNPDLQQIRYPIRRQSTLPNRATEHHYQQQAQQPKLLPISPNRTYSRSTEKCNANKPMREMVGSLLINASLDFLKCLLQFSTFNSPRHLYDNQLFQQMLPVSNHRAIHFDRKYYQPLPVASITINRPSMVASPIFIAVISV